MTLTDRRFKVLSIIAASALLLFAVGLVYTSAVRNADAARPADFGLREGDTVSAAGSDDPDVYIVNDAGFKRLFLNPVIFGFYGHLGGFANVKSISPATRDAFPTSGLFRKDGDQKVYGVETTGEDTGVLHWVNTTGAQAAVDDPDFFKKVFIINDNEFNWYAKGADYTSVSQVPSYARATTPGATPLPSTGTSVSVSAGSMPTGSVLPKGANSVTVGNFVFTAPSSGAITVSGLTVKRSGVGSVSDISNAYVYDGANRLSSGRTFNTSTNTTTFSLNVAVPAGTSKTLTLQISLATGATASSSHSFSLESASAVNATGAIVSGSFPISTGTFTVSGTSAGTLTLTKTGSISNPRVGDREAKVSEFTLAASTEDALLSLITMTQGGNIANSALTNFKLKQSGTTVATASAIASNSRLALVFSPTFRIERGNSRIFELYADVAGRSADTVIFYVEEQGDLQATGGTFGTGMTSTVTAMDTTGEAHTLTLQGGQFTINWQGPSSRNISNTSSDVTVWEGTIFTANNVEVRNWRVRIQDTNATDPDLADASATAAVQDVKIWNADTNVVIAGPKELTAGANNQSEILVFADTVNLAASTTTKIKITLDVRNTPASSTITLLASLNAFEANDIKNTDSNVFLTPATDVSPNSAVPGQNQTVTAGTLTVATAPSPTDNTIVKGSSEKEASAFNLTAGSGDRIKVTNVVVTGGLSDADDNVYEGTAAQLQALVLSLKLMDGATQLGQTKSFSTSSTATFDNLNLFIEASQTKKLSVVITTNNSASLLSSNSDFLRFSIETSGVTSVDSEGNTVTPSGIPTNSTEGAGDTVVTVASAGTLNASLAPTPANPASGLFTAGTTDRVLSAYKFEAINDSFFVKKFVLLPYVAGANGAGSNDRISTLQVRYKNQAGATVLQSVGLSGTSNNVDVSANPMYVPQNGSANLEVLGSFAQFTILDGTEAENITFALKASDATNNQATGAGSNSDVTAFATSDLVGNRHNVNRTVLTAAKGTGTPENALRSRSASQNVASYRFTAASNSNAFFRGSRKAIDGATTSWAATGTGAPATSATAVSGTSSISSTEDGVSAANDHFDFDFGASAGLTAYNRMSFWIRSSAAKAVGDMGISVSSTRDATDTGSLDGLGTVDLNNVDLSAALTAAQWQFQDFAVTTSATSRFVTFNIKANPDNAAVILVDDLRFYNDNIAATVAGNFAAATAINGLTFDLKDSAGTIRAYGAYTGTGGGAGSTGTVTLIPGLNTDVTAITTYSDVEVDSTGATYDLVANTNTLMAADTTANENLSVTVQTGTVTSAGNFRWYDNSDTAGSNNIAGITVISPTSTTLDFSNNY